MGNSDQQKSSLQCRLADRCSGCDRAHLDSEELERERRSELQRLGLGDVPTDVTWIDAGRLRDRLEFTLEASKLGLFAKTGDASQTRSRQIVDIDVCPQLSPALQEWLTEFRNDLPKVAAPRSVRLRVSPQGLRGVWLDFANEDIRDLLEEGEWLSRQLAKDVVVEVGQKRKRVATNPDGPRAHRLIDPTLEAWFETAVLEPATNRLISAPLFSTIGTFTQPGFIATRVLVRTVLEHLGVLNTGANFEGRRLAEFGAGIGCFTLPLLSTGAAVDVFESDRLALTALSKSAERMGVDSKRLRIHAGDFILSKRTAEKALANGDDPGGNPPKYDTVFVDPPRPGLGVFIDAISAQAQGADWIYVSCYPESFAKDATALHEKGFKLTKLTVVEQFPFTRHFELVASFSPM